MKLNVPGISCEHCVKRIESALKAVAGVKKIEISVKKKTVEVSGTASEEDIVSAIKEAGYEPSPA
jgi:Au+-exporting ATPase